jgi:hypothetical protein
VNVSSFSVKCTQFWIKENTFVYIQDGLNEFNPDAHAYAKIGFNIRSSSLNHV